MINEHQSVYLGGMKQNVAFLIKALYIIQKPNSLLMEVLFLINIKGRIHKNFNETAKIYFLCSLMYFYCSKSSKSSRIRLQQGENGSHSLRDTSGF